MSYTQAVGVQHPKIRRETFTQQKEQSINNFLGKELVKLSIYFDKFICSLKRSNLIIKQ